MAAVATVLVGNLSALLPLLASREASAVVAIYAVFAAVNILGVERGARLNSALTIAKILPLLLLIGAGIFAIAPGNLAIGEPPDVATLARSSIDRAFGRRRAEVLWTSGGTSGQNRVKANMLPTAASP